MSKLRLKYLVVIGAEYHTLIAQSTVRIQELELEVCELKKDLKAKEVQLQELIHTHELDKIATLGMIETQVRQTIGLKDQAIQHLVEQKGEAEARVNALQTLMEQQRQVNDFGMRRASPEISTIGDVKALNFAKQQYQATF